MWTPENGLRCLKSMHTHSLHKKVSYFGSTHKTWTSTHIPFLFWIEQVACDMFALCMMRLNSFKPIISDMCEMFDGKCCIPGFKHTRSSEYLIWLSKRRETNKLKKAHLQKARNQWVYLLAYLCWQKNSCFRSFALF